MRPAEGDAVFAAFTSAAAAVAAVLAAAIAHPAPEWVHLGVDYDLPAIRNGLGRA